MTLSIRTLSTYQNGASGVVSIPGSKSITNRVLLLAALSDGETRIDNSLESEDAQLMREALQQLGVHIDKQGNTLTVDGAGGLFKTGNYELYLGNAGTAMRFLTAAMSFVEGEVKLYGKERMHQRPIGNLVQALSKLGAEITAAEKNKYPPVFVAGKGTIPGGACKVSGKISSQFLSAILHIAPLTNRGVHLNIEPPLVSKPYLEMTIKLIEHFGVFIKRLNDLEFEIEPQRYSGTDITVEGDASSAAHIMALVLAAGGEAELVNYPLKSIQGDARFVEVARKMGAVVRETENGIKIVMQEELQPLGEYDFSNMPDVALPAATVCALANGKSVLTGLSTLRDKECDRIEALRLNLERMGASVKATADTLEIDGDKTALHGAMIDTYDDHRVAMSFAALGTVIEGVQIENPDCVQKTYPEFWQAYETLAKTD